MNSPLKVVAVGSSLLLAGGFVWYRARGVSDVVRSGSPGVTKEAAPTPEMLVGPKSAPMFRVVPGAVVETPAAPTMLGGSKFNTVMTPEEAATLIPATQPAVILGSSKSAIMIRPDDMGTLQAGTTQPANK